MPALFGTPYLVKKHKVLEDVQKFACRVCTKDWHTDYQYLLDGLHIPSLELKRRAMRLCFMYKLINSNTQILSVSQKNCPYTTCSTYSKQLENISCHSSQYSNSYFLQTLLTGITYQHPLYHVIILLVLSIIQVYVLVIILCSIIP